MATKSEQFKSNAQRTGAAKSHAAPGAVKAEEHGHAEKKATVAREEQGATGNPSRKSTRKSANRAKSDAPIERAEQMKENTPKSQHARTSAHPERGNPAGGSR